MKKISLLSMMLLTAMLTMAGVRSAEQAAELASAYMSTQCLKAKSTADNRALAPARVQMKLVATRQKMNSVEPAFYVFNNGADEFVIISGDDRTQDVLGYSNAGAYDENNLPDGFRFYLNYMAERISHISPSAVKEAAAETKSYKVIAPLLGKTEWNQETPFNKLCPMDGDSTRSATGCVATAAAQIMRYWRWPEKGTGSHSYRWKNCRRQSTTLTVDFSQTTYEWDNMLDTYIRKNSYNDAQANAVATLMYHCGVACDMVYGGKEAGGSGAYTDDMMRGLTKYFGYDEKTARYLDQLSETEPRPTRAQMAAYFRTDLENGRPVLMGGTDKDNEYGHEFVCDGQDENGKFHINWGWSGSCNGYYALDGLTPSELGIGAGDAGDYSYNLDAVIGIQPKREAPKPDEDAEDISMKLDYAEAVYDSEKEYWTILLTNNATEIPWLQFALYGNSATSFAGDYQAKPTTELNDDETFGVMWLTDNESADVTFNSGTFFVQRVRDAEKGPCYYYYGQLVGNNGKKYFFQLCSYTSIYDEQSEQAIVPTDPIRPNPMGIDQTSMDTTVFKTIVNGQLLIHRAGKIYNVTGNEIK